MIETPSGCCARCGEAQFDNGYRVDCACLRIWHRSPSLHESYGEPVFVGQERPVGCPICDWERSRERATAARLVMSRLAAWAWCEANAQREAGAWNPMPHEGNDAPWMRVYRRRALAIALELGVLRVDWGRS